MMETKHYVDIFCRAVPEKYLKIAKENKLSHASVYIAGVMALISATRLERKLDLMERKIMLKLKEMHAEAR